MGSHLDAAFYAGNRKRLCEQLPERSLALVFAGQPIRQSADAYYPFEPHRSFVYLCGLDIPQMGGSVLLMAKLRQQPVETLFIPPKDQMQERWKGRRLSGQEAHAKSGVEMIEDVEGFVNAFHRLAQSGDYSTVFLDLDLHQAGDPRGAAYSFADGLAKDYPYLEIRSLHPLLRGLRTIKQPCEIEAMCEAMSVTREGVLAMMQGCRPGLYEHQLKALFDAQLNSRGVTKPAFPPIISTGANNFFIHYDAYDGQIKPDDMILVDVGARRLGLCNDVSRAWPAGGRFNDRQGLLYTCAYNTSEHMFSLIRPGIPMADVDQIARRYCYEQLKAIGLLSDYADIGRYMWHGGAHHVGFDVHDVVDMTREVSPGMVFCVDIGIYCEEWGIGFRLEDNCLVTEDGCVNLSQDIPRSIEAIEAAVQGK